MLDYYDLGVPLQIKKEHTLAGNALFLFVGSGYPLYLLVCIKQTNQKDAAPIPNAVEISAKKMEFSVLIL